MTKKQIYSLSLKSGEQNETGSKNEYSGRNL